MRRMRGEIKAGTLYGVGVGPGDPELMTLKALRVLKEADVIAAPVSKESSPASSSNALGVVKKNMSMEGKVILPLFFPMTKDEEAVKASRRAGAEEIAERLKEGDDVAFVTLGDPMLYSTFSYLVPLVKGLVPGAGISAVPGVNSFSAAAARALTPLAESGEKVIIIPASYGKEELRRWLKEFDTIVLMKVKRDMDSLVNILDEEGLADKALFASRVGWDKEEVVAGIRGLEGRDLDYFSMVIVRR